VLNRFLALFDAVPASGWVFAVGALVMCARTIARTAVHLFLLVKSVMAAIHPANKEDGERALKVIDKLIRGRWQR
jgi:hypothetical protein